MILGQLKIGENQAKWWALWLYGTSSLRFFFGTELIFNCLWLKPEDNFFFSKEGATDQDKRHFCTLLVRPKKTKKKNELLPFFQHQITNQPTVPWRVIMIITSLSPSCRFSRYRSFLWNWISVCHQDFYRGTEN